MLAAALLQPNHSSALKFFHVYLFIASFPDLESFFAHLWWFAFGISSGSWEPLPGTCRVHKTSGSPPSCGRALDPRGCLGEATFALHLHAALPSVATHCVAKSPPAPTSVKARGPGAFIRRVGPSSVEVHQGIVYPLGPLSAPRQPCHPVFMRCVSLVLRTMFPGPLCFAFQGVVCHSGPTTWLLSGSQCGHISWVHAAERDAFKVLLARTGEGRTGQSPWYRPKVPLYRMI